MRKIVALVVLVAAAVILWPREAAQAGSPCTVPKSWGRVAATYATSMNTMVVFEAVDGTVRIVNAQCGTPEKANYTVLRSE